MTSSNDTNGIDSESSLVHYSTLKKIPGNHQLLSVALNSQINYLNTGINNSHSTNHPDEGKEEEEKLLIEGRNIVKQVTSLSKHSYTIRLAKQKANVLLLSQVLGRDLNRGRE